MSREEGWGILGEGAPGATNVSVNCFKKKKKDWINMYYSTMLIRDEIWSWVHEYYIIFLYLKSTS